jgi:hypothetical protein
MRVRLAAEITAPPPVATTAPAPPNPGSAHSERKALASTSRNVASLRANRSATQCPLSRSRRWSRSIKTPPSRAANAAPTADFPEAIIPTKNNGLRPATCRQHTAKGPPVTTKNEGAAKRRPFVFLCPRVAARCSYPPMLVLRLMILGVKKISTSVRVSASRLFLKNHPMMGTSAIHGTFLRFTDWFRVKIPPITAVSPS